MTLHFETPISIGVFRFTVENVKLDELAHFGDSTAQRTPILIDLSDVVFRHLAGPGHFERSPRTACTGGAFLGGPVARRRTAS